MSTVQETAADTGIRDGGWRARIRRCWRLLAHAGRMLVGMPDYDAYVRHLRTRHPEREAMSRDQFFRSRQEARYGGGTGRCC